jgi:hypothetical protein
MWPPIEASIARENSMPHDVHLCSVCGAVMREIHCKIICPKCGYMRDCSDP